MSGREKARETARSAGSTKTSADKNVHGAGDSFPQWTHLSCANIELMMNESVDQVQKQFADVLDLKKHHTCVNEASLLSYFVTGFWWANQMSFTSQQISFIMALLQLLLDNIKNQHMSFADNFKEFTLTLQTIRQSSQSARTTFNPLFDVDQIKSIKDYFMSSLFQHYSLYEFLFTHPRDDMVLTMEGTIEVVNAADFIAPLEEGTPVDDLHHEAPSPSSSPDQDLDPSVEKNGEESGECEQGERPENLESFSVDDVREVLGEATREMLVKLQADFSEKLHIQEKTYTARLESLKRLASKKL